MKQHKSDLSALILFLWIIFAFWLAGCNAYDPGFDASKRFDALKDSIVAKWQQDSLFMDSINR